jgi:hypothetical protein
MKQNAQMQYYELVNGTPAYIIIFRQKAKEYLFQTGRVDFMKKIFINETIPNRLAVVQHVTSHYIDWAIPALK